MGRQYAYIDEFGNSDLDIEKEGASSHFIITAILIDEEKVNEVSLQVEEIRKKYFQTGEIKSSSVGSDHNRRIKILTQLSKLDIQSFTIVIDKSKLISEGYKYKPVFHKNLPRIILNILKDTFPNIKISADEHGSKEFMLSFKKYLKNSFPSDLFNTYEFYFTDSKTCNIVQVADFFAGTIARNFDTEKYTEKGKEFLSIIKNNIYEVREWPLPRIEPYLLDVDSSTPAYDADISNYSMNLARSYIKLKEKSNGLRDKDQVSFLKYLIFNLIYYNPNKFIPTWEILQHINHNRKNDLTMHGFRALVGKLRDNHIIISSNDYGYKLPTSEGDLIHFVNHFNRYIQPMLERLDKCRKSISMLTKKKLDILDKPEYANLKKLLDE